MELKSSKKYGLVWDNESAKEKVVEMCEKTIPTLKDKKYSMLFLDSYITTQQKVE